MTSSEIKPEPIVAKETELGELAILSQLLNEPSNGSRPQLPRLVSPEGEEIELPASVFRLLRQQVYQLARGNGVMTVIFHEPLPTGEAAKLLDVPRQHLVQLLKDGEIPSTGYGLERRIRFEDLMAYKQKWDELRRQGLAEMTRMCDDLGLYSTALLQTEDKSGS
ncbi:MAG: helix-turn-helix domain-containing protein [Hormoscilla sp.]